MRSLSRLFGGLYLGACGRELLLRRQIVRIFEPVDLLYIEFLGETFQLDLFLHVIEAEEQLTGLDALPRPDSDGGNRASVMAVTMVRPSSLMTATPVAYSCDPPEDQIAGASHKHDHQQPVGPVRPARRDPQ